MKILSLAPPWLERNGVRASGALSKWDRCRILTWSVILKFSCGCPSSLLRWGNLSHTLTQHSSSLFFKTAQVCLSAQTFDQLSIFWCHSEFFVKGNMGTRGLATSLSSEQHANPSLFLKGCFKSQSQYGTGEKAPILELETWGQVSLDFSWPWANYSV